MSNPCFFLDILLLKKEHTYDNHGKNGIDFTTKDTKGTKNGI
jgi:hypothetical protein